MMNRVVVNPYIKKPSSYSSPSPTTSRKRPRPKENFNTIITSNNQHNATTTESSKPKPSPPTPDTTISIHNNGNNTSNDASALIISASDKAGMQGIDRTKIDAIILRTSGNSLFMQQQRRRDGKVNQRITTLQGKLQDASESEYAITDSLEFKLQEYQSLQPSRSTKVVVDMDMFYMACELLTKPHLKNVPACVGRGMILTSNYKARKYGVRSAMPGFVGDALVNELSRGKEHLVHCPSNFDLYKEKSNVVVETLKKYDLNLQSYSLDEAYLDISAYMVLYLNEKQRQYHQLCSNASIDQIHEVVQTKLLQEDSSSLDYLTILQQNYPPHICYTAACEIVAHLRSSVETATGGLTCSAGIAPNFGLAKIASDKNKPNGQLFVKPEEAKDFIHNMPVRKIPGIGRVTEKILQQVLNISLTKELYDKRGMVQWLFQPATAEFLLKASVGCFGKINIDGTHEDEGGGDDEGRKGMSRERTFAPETNVCLLKDKLREIADMLSKDMKHKQVMAHTITVKVKLNTYDVLSRSRSLQREVYTQEQEEIYKVAHGLFEKIESELEQDLNCRLLGIRCTGLVPSQSIAKPMDKFVITKKMASNETAKVDLISQAEEEKEVPEACSIHSENDESSPSKTLQDDNSVTATSLEKECHICPLCNLEIIGSNEVLNQHIDTCLNASTVRQMVKQSTSHEGNRKRTKLRDFWTTSNTS